jgi:hypothetical protein
MLTWKPMRNPRASRGQNLELISMHIMFLKGYHAEDEGVPGSEIRVHVYE